MANDNSANRARYDFKKAMEEIRNYRGRGTELISVYVPFGKLILATIPPILANALVVPFVLKYAYGVPLPIPVMMLTVGAGEVIGCGVLGFFLGRLILRYRGRIRFS